MTALLAYRTALLLRSQRWLAPVLLYAAVLAVGVQSGRPVLDSLGWAAAGLLPVTAWLVRICATQEPAAARYVTAAAAGPARAHLSVLLAAAGTAAALGCAATGVVVALSDLSGADHRAAIPAGHAAAAGLLACAVSVLTGSAAGALCTRPLLHARGWSLAAAAVAALLALVTTGSPAKAAVTGLVTGSRTGAVHLPLLPLTVAALMACAASAVACRLVSRRGADGGPAAD
ncbi:ABC transporter [Streptomyces sp. t39]|uniref:ABC transporter n=1 Tax=Streptomyces sp. t39 TaxID=1828156 RepID=UPI0021C7CEC7|nr:ABC transporter [Streptomyces sp. t39]